MAVLHTSSGEERLSTTFGQLVGLGWVCAYWRTAAADDESGVVDHALAWGRDTCDEQLGLVKVQVARYTLLLILATKVGSLQMEVMR